MDDIDSTLSALLLLIETICVFFFFAMLVKEEARSWVGSAKLVVGESSAGRIMLMPMLSGQGGTERWPFPRGSNR